MRRVLINSSRLSDEMACAETWTKRTWNVKGWRRQRRRTCSQSSVDEPPPPISSARHGLASRWPSQFSHEYPVLVVAIATEWRAGMAVFSVRPSVRPSLSVCLFVSLCTATENDWSWKLPNLVHMMKERGLMKVIVSKFGYLEHIWERINWKRL